MNSSDKFSSSMHSVHFPYYGNGNTYKKEKEIEKEIIYNRLSHSALRKLHQCRHRLHPRPLRSTHDRESKPRSHHSIPPSNTRRGQSTASEQKPAG